MMDATDPRMISKGMHIEVQELYYSIQLKKNPESTKVILKNLSFKLTPGSLCALMGPSGSGKSTLLDLLADRKKEGQWSGTILFNGGSRSRWFQRDSAYILQDDLHIPTLTVKETIYFAAATRLPEGTSKEFIEERVTSLLDIMGLDHIQDNMVGGTDLRGISGGQMKRLSIAVEIIALPDIIFLDEPTSGLDSLMAMEVVNAVRKLANQNRTCVSTIHQPSPQVFELFDTEMLIAEGRMIYFGPIGEVVGHFRGLGYQFQQGENPAEFIIEISQRARSSTSLGKLTALELETQFLCSDAALDLMKQKYSSSSMGDMNRTTSEIDLKEPDRLHATTKYTQFKMLLYRDFLSITRDTDEIIALISKNIVVGLLIGIVFFQQVKVTLPLFNDYGVPDPEVANISALIFFGMMHTMVSNVEAIPHLVTKSLLFRREVSAFAYSVSPYWLSHSLTIIPLLLMGFLAFALSTYFLVSFPLSPEYVLYFFTIMFLASLSSYYLAMAIAAYTNDQKLSLTIFPLCFLFLSTFAGYAIPIGDVSPMWRWATTVSYVRWAFQGLMVNQWSKYDSAEDNDGYQTVLEMYDFDNFNKYSSYWIMCLTIGIMLTLSYLALRPSSKRVKKLSRQVVLGIVKEEEMINPIYNHSSNSSLLSPLLNESKSGKELKEDLDEMNGGGVQGDIEANNTSKSVTIPHSKGVNISFRHISYTIYNTQTKQSNTILDNVYGYIKAGQMCALMGSSGAGKSTLLDILANRKTMGKIEGEIYINQYQLYSQTTLAASPIATPKGEKRVDIRKISAYVMQDNILYANLTVYESLYYAALLRLPSQSTMAEKEHRIEQILTILGLNNIKNSYIGDEKKRGISGGQKKRVSIGVEIIHLPDVIYLDEPTTGLDSTIAYEVMSSIYTLTKYNRTILCTIHQPSFRTFDLFHSVLLLSKGQVVYYGSIERVREYFSVLCKVKYRYEENMNPADFMISITSNPMSYLDGEKERGSIGSLGGREGAKEGVSIEELSEIFLHSSMGIETKEVIQELILESSRKVSYERAMEGEGGKGEEVEYNTSLIYQMRVLTDRLVKRKWRSKHIVLATTARHAVIGLFYGTVYFQQPNGTDTSAYNNRLSMLFFSLLFVLMGHQEDIANILEDRMFFYRERSVYSTLAYYLSNLLVQVPLNVINVTCYSILVYTLVGFRSDINNFFFFLYVMLLTDFIGMMVCQIVSNISSSTQVAMSFFPVSLFFSTAFEGFIVYLPSFPPWLGWLSFASYMRFSFQALVLNELADNNKLPLAQTYIDELGFESLSKWLCADILWVFLVLFMTISYLILANINFEKR